MLAGALTVPAAGRAHVIVEPDRAAAIELAISRAGKGDVVLIAGKGHERGQYAGTVGDPVRRPRGGRARRSPRRAGRPSAGGPRGGRASDLGDL